MSLTRHRIVVAAASMLAYSSPALAQGPQDQPASTAAGTSTGAATIADSLPRLVYSVNRVPEAPFETARSVTVITGDEIRRRNARSLPDVLVEEGVSFHQTQPGAAYPIMRGLSGKRVLVLLDGVQLNNATSKFNLATIDLATVDRIEIVRGVGSVLGSESLGGIINVITRKGPTTPNTGAMRTGAGVRYSSGDASQTGHVALEGRGTGFRYLVGGTYQKNGNIRAGETLGEQIPSGFRQRAANASADVYLGTARTLSLGYQLTRQSDVPRPDRILDGSHLRYYESPNTMQVGSLRYLDITDRSWMQALQVTTYWHREDEAQQTIRASRPEITAFERHSDVLSGLNVELSSTLGDNHRIIYGFDATTETVRSRGADSNTTTGVTTARRARYMDDAGFHTAAAYLQDRVAIGQRLTVTLGARYSGFWAEGTETTSIGALDIGSRNGGLTTALNVMYHVTPGVNVVANVASGFRAPNIDDISTFERRPSGTEVPNPGLSPEKLTGYETGVKFTGQRIAGSVFAYYNDLRGLLVRLPGTYQGKSYIDSNGNGVQDAGEPIVLQKFNVGDATTYGTEIDLRVRLLPTLVAFGSHSTMFAEDENGNVPLSRTPPPFGTAGLRWTPVTAGRAWMEGVVHFASAQHRLSPEDSTDRRIGPQGTPGFAAVTLRAGYTLFDRLPLTLAVENVADQRYKYHAAGYFRPGRQIVFGAAYRY